MYCEINSEVFFARPGLSASHVTADWQPVTTKPFDHQSYGHDIEFAWLMLRAHEVLGNQKNTTLFASLLANALQGGFD